jgi:Ca-activated chloride channel family protein
MLRTVLYCFASLVFAACGMSASDDAGGGNVGFGGAQDIGQFRAILDQGGIPGENTLDANGFFNEHYTELPAAECGEVICLEGMLSVGTGWVNDDYQAMLQIALTSPVDPADLERLPLNLVVVVDTSGSMSVDDRIGYARQGLDLLIDELQDGDRLAIVSYSSGVTVWADLTDELDRETLHGVVDQLIAEGSTNFHDGLRDGFEIALESLDLERQNRVIMMSDGLPTAGITDDTSIIQMSEDYIRSGIGLTTIGVGSDFNVDLMRGLAERGAGNFYYLEDAAATQEVFTEELDFFVTPLALAVDISVSASPAYDLGEVVGTRLWKTEGNGGSMFVPGVFLSSRTSDEPGPDGRRGGGSTLFIRMSPNGFYDEPNNVAVVTVTYRLPGSDEVMEQSIAVTNPLEPGDLGEDDYYSHAAATAENFAMYNVYLGLRDATRQAEYDYNCALDSLVRADANAARWNAEHADDDIDADRALMAQFMVNLRERGAREATPGNDYCANGGYPDDGYYDDEAHYHHCSASGGGAGWSFALLALVGLVATRRRRRSL